MLGRSSRLVGQDGQVDRRRVPQWQQYDPAARARMAIVARAAATPPWPRWLTALASNLSGPNSATSTSSRSLLLVGGKGGGEVGFGGRLVDAEAGEHARAVFEFQQRQQNVLGPDVVVAHPQRLPERELQRLFRP
jgi:hypothetical protein